MKAGLYFSMLTMIGSCVQWFFPGAFSTDKLFKAAQKIAKREGYYKINDKGDTLSATPKEGLEIAKNNAGDIIECSTKYGIIKWNGYEWVTYFVKGKVNMYYSFTTTGTTTSQRYNSMTKTWSTIHSPTHSFRFYFEKKGTGIMDVELAGSLESIKDAIKDDPNCLNKLNKLVPNGNKMDQTKVKGMWEIMNSYNN